MPDLFLRKSASGTTDLWLHKAGATGALDPNLRRGAILGAGRLSGQLQVLASRSGTVAGGGALAGAAELVTAPVITWGVVTGNEAGQLFQIAYTIDRPSVISAELELPDGRPLTMTVQATKLTVFLPLDTPSGEATVHALVRNTDGQEATRTATVMVSGEEEAPPRPPIGGGLPAMAFLPVTRPSRTVLRLQSRSRRRVRVRATVRLTVRSRSRIRIRAGRRTRVLVAPEARMVVGVRSRSRGTVTATVAISRRAEGPRAEEELLLLL